MSVFFNVLTPDKALALMLDRVEPLQESETVSTVDALNRVTAASLSAPHSLPTFRRSTMDGYAVKAADTYGATTSLPAYLRIVGEVLMGKPADIKLGAGDAAIIHTGGHLPDDADAVVQVENTQAINEQEIEVIKAAAVGENVIQIGEDVEAGDEVLPAGHWIRPQDVGGLLALGILEVLVARKPTVALLSSGDEVVSPWDEMKPGQVRDINSYTTAALAGRAGAVPKVVGLVADDPAALRRATQEAFDSADMVVLSAGSSVSVRDATGQAIAALGEPGILFHGIAVKPGKPTIGAIVDGKPVIGLPGNPVSAMNLFDLLVMPIIYRLLGCTAPPPKSVVKARVTRNVAATPGREDHIAVRLVEREDGLWAEPVLGKSNLIYTLIRSVGTFVIPLDAGGVTAGETVRVTLF